MKISEKNQKRIVCLAGVLCAMCIISLSFVYAPPWAQPKQSVCADFSQLSMREYSKMNLNTADAKTLQLLPNVGENIARYIIEYRVLQHPFMNLDMVDEVWGVDAAMIARWGDLAYVALEE